VVSEGRPACIARIGRSIRYLCKTWSAYHGETPIGNAKRKDLSDRGAWYTMAATAGPENLNPSLGSDPWMLVGVGLNPSRRHCLYSPRGRMRMSVRLEPGIRTYNTYRQ